jgi:hypothetical protein
MELKLKISKDNIITFEQLLSFLKEINEKAKFTFSKDKITINTMNSSVSLASFVNLKPEIYSEYVCDTDTTFCLDIKYLDKIFKSAKGTDLIMTFDSKVGNMIEYSNKKFTFELYDVEESFNKEFKIKYNNNSTILSEEIKEVLSDMKIVIGEDDSAQFNMSVNNLNVIVQNDMGGSKKYTYDFQKAKIKNDEEIKSFFGRYMLKNVEKAFPSYFNEFKISFNKEYPMQVVYEKDNILVTTVIAPLVSND